MQKISELIFGLATLCLMGFVLVSMLQNNQSDKVVTSSDKNQIDTNKLINKQNEFKLSLESAVSDAGIRPIEGYTPIIFMDVLPGLIEQDFDQVEASIGNYEYEGSKLRHDLGGVEMIHSAADAITAKGMNQLLHNVSKRLNTNSVEEIVGRLQKESKVDDFIPIPPVSGNPVPKEEDDLVMCTMDAMQCPDGSFVGRTGPNCEFVCPTIIDEPVACTEDARVCADGSVVVRSGQNCEFAACPSELPEVVTCTPESKQLAACTKIYDPVCAPVEVRCVTTPCEPIPQTFGNSCTACMNENVSSYTEGECDLQVS